MHNQICHFFLIYFEHQWPLVHFRTEILKTRTLGLFVLRQGSSAAEAILGHTR